MEFRHFAPTVILDHIPPWHCPSCNGLLRVKALDAIEEENAITRYERIMNVQRSHNIRTSRHVTLLTCEICFEPVLLVGTTQWFNVDATMKEFVREDVRQLTISHFEPTLPVFSVPTGCPETVKEALYESFSVYWKSPSSAANAMRIALERLMDALGVSAASGEGRPLPLHHRIDEYNQTSPEIGEFLLAVKWVGNQGSHGESIQHHAVLEAYEMLQHSLDKLYGTRISELTERAKTINRDRGIR